MTHDSIINQFSSHLFWDIDRDKLDWNKHRMYIVERVLEYGVLSDWKLLRSPKEEFRCYTTKQSIPPHWNF